jgi:dolichol-phosphate mannosyltransferase
MPDADAAIIVPTYCEAQNLPLLVPRISGALAAAGRSADIVVVDDASPDDPEGVCSELALEYPVRCLVRHDERGLSSAVLHGMRQTSAPLLVVLDADLSHPPERIPALLDALDNGADFALGSRYVPGGSTEEGWGFLRMLNSRIATLLARPLVSVKDPMAGFLAIRRNTLEAGAPLDPLGFKIALELMVKCRCRNVAELPIHFSKRQHGESKLGLREQVNYLRHLLRLYLFRLRDGRTA